jgi:hypothetical protein
VEANTKIRLKRQEKQDFEYNIAWPVINLMAIRRNPARLGSGSLGACVLFTPGSFQELRALHEESPLLLWAITFRLLLQATINVLDLSISFDPAQSLQILRNCMNSRVRVVFRRLPAQDRQ